MEPISRKTQSLVLPTSYEDYLQLCQSKGIDPQLDKPTFESALEDRRYFAAHLATVSTRRKVTPVITYLEGLSNEQILRKLGVALHLDELVSTT